MTNISFISIGTAMGTIVPHNFANAYTARFLELKVPSINLYTKYLVIDS